MINSMSDLETDTATKEINAAKASPWPDDMRDSIWSDRLLLRFKMKKEMKVYRKFLEGVVKDNGSDCEDIDMKDAVPILHQFCTNELSIKQLRGIFQLPRSELLEILKSRYNICNAYGVVYCCVVEQVANFKITKYPVDARCNTDGDNTEEIFEEELKYQKVGPGFTMNITTEGEKVNDEVLLKFLQRVVSLAGPTLLARAPKVSHDIDEGSGGDDNGSEQPESASEQSNSNGPSFRSDRRIARLMIAKYWADRLIEKYNEAQTKKEEEQMIESPEVAS